MYQDLLVTISKCCKTDLGRITERSTDNDTMILHGGNRDDLEGSTRCQGTLNFSGKKKYHSQRITVLS